METGLLTAFIAVAECSSFSKASEQLHLTQSAVSKRLATLENELDTKLFERFGQRIQLTDSGRLLLRDARDIVDKVKQMRQQNDINKNRIAGKLKIATSHHIGLYRLPHILQKLIQKYPEIQLDMYFTDSEIAYEEISHGGFDIAIATLPHKTSHHVKTTHLWDDELVVMFAKNHPLNKKNTLSAQDLANYQAILPDSGTFTRRIIDNVFTDNHITHQLAFTTNYLETIKVMVETGMGWSVLPQIMQSETLASRSLPTQKDDYNQPIRQLGIMIHKNKIITPALQALIGALEYHQEINESYL